MLIDHLFLDVFCFSFKLSFLTFSTIAIKSFDVFFASKKLLFFRLSASVMLFVFKLLSFFLLIFTSLASFLETILFLRIAILFFNFIVVFFVCFCCFSSLVSATYIASFLGVFFNKVSLIIF